MQKRKVQKMGNRQVFVNVYSTESRYGGAEEGGWYYTCGTPVVSKATTCFKCNTCGDVNSKYGHSEFCPAGHWESILSAIYSNKSEYANSYTHDANGVNYLDTMDVPTEFAGEVVTSGSYEIRVEDHPGEAWPEYRPHYE